MDLDSAQQLPSPSPTATTSSEMTTPEPYYQFPTQKLRRRQTQPGKMPLVLVACGSFSPITFLHLRMFAMAADYVRMNTDFEVVGGYLSPVSDAYKKVGLAPASHRINMCELAVQTSKWISVDPWEATQPSYVPTAEVLDHFHREINTVMRGVEDVDGKRTNVRIALLAGADLIQTMSQPDVWSARDLEHILGDFGVFVLERAGTDIDEALASLKQWEDKIYCIPQVIPNEISSTKVRLLLRRQMSIDYLTPDEVVDYIEENGLYREEDATHIHTGKGKAKASPSTG